jgi:SAM-dependent methyltransferase
MPNRETFGHRRGGKTSLKPTCATKRTLSQGDLGEASLEMIPTMQGRESDRRPEDLVAEARFFHAALETFGPGNLSQPVALDFGCGAGGLVDALAGLGWDMYGCDVEPFWRGTDHGRDADRYRTIPLDPYRLPFADGTFDVVTSESVFEHVQNVQQCFREIHRVLKPGGVAMHLFPGKWYLPSEPHVYVPLSNVLWPRCPRWWFSMWALLGVRNEHQRGEAWRSVAERNDHYHRTQLNYLTNREYRRLSIEAFGNYSSPMKFYIDHAIGGYARLCRRLPMKRLTGRLGSNIRMSFVIQRRTEMVSERSGNVT